MYKHPALRKVGYAVMLMVLVMGAGIAGYSLLEGWDFQDSAWMTVITLATVGYGEAKPLDTTGRWFTICLIIGGMGVLLYAVSSLTAFIVEGELLDVLRRARMEKQIEKLSGHHIICGAGRVGMYICTELLRTGHSVVVIDQDVTPLESLGGKGPAPLTLQGDPTSDEVLEKAGIRKAAGLFAALHTDKDNLFVVLSARGLNSRLRIVARGDEEASRDKLLRAGADGVVLTHSIGGMRMASEMIRPTVVGFLDTMLRERESTLRVAEAAVREGASLAGKTVEEAAISERTGALLLALRGQEGAFEFNPPAHMHIRAGVTLIVMGDKDQVRALCKLAGCE